MLGHLVRRFLGSLWPFGPGVESEAWARRWLLPGEVAIWESMPAADRRHAVAVARRVSSPDRAVMAAALLHDSGKVVSGYGTFRRVLATAVGLAVGRDRVGGRMGSYLRHPALGADALAAAGSDPLTIAWAREHHLPPERWTVPAEVGADLKAADDD